MIGHANIKDNTFLSETVDVYANCRVILQANYTEKAFVEI